MLPPGDEEGEGDGEADGEGDGDVDGEGDGGGADGDGEGEGPPPLVQGWKVQVKGFLDWLSRVCASATVIPEPL